MKNIPFRKVESNNYCWTISLLNWLSQSTPFLLCSFLLSSSDFCSFLLLVLLFLSPSALSPLIAHCAQLCSFLMLYLDCQLHKSRDACEFRKCTTGHGCGGTCRADPLMRFLFYWMNERLDLSHNTMVFGADMVACPLTFPVLSFSASCPS